MYREQIRTRNNALDFLKFVFAILILLYHSVYVFQTDNVKIYPGGGYIGVEFFFIVSGFLMAKSVFASAEKQSGKLLLGDEMFRFFKRKIKILYPYFLYAYVVSVIVQATVYQMAGNVLWENLLASIWELLLLHRLVAQFYCWVGGSWYISAMIIGMFFIFPALRRYLKIYAEGIAPGIVFLYVSYFSHKYGYIHVTDNSNGWFYDCLIRAVGDLNLGIIAYIVSEKIRKISFTKLGRRAISVLAFLGYTCVICGTFFRSWGYMDFVWLFCIAACVAVTGSEAGNFCRFLGEFSSKPFYFLGTFSMALYMNHLVCQHIVNAFFSGWKVGKRVTLFCAMAFALTLSCILFVNFTDKFGSRIKEAVRQKLLFMRE